MGGAAGVSNFGNSGFRFRLRVDMGFQRIRTNLSILSPMEKVLLRVEIVLLSECGTKVAKDLRDFELCMCVCVLFVIAGFLGVFHADLCQSCWGRMGTTSFKSLGVIAASVYF